MSERKLLVVIDSNSIIHRAFHALPPLTTKKGELVGAVYGFLLVFLKAVREFQPDFIVACFDFPSPTFRHQQYKEYKATRPPTAQGIVEQIPKVKEVLSVFGVPIFEKQGFEADDLIGTIVKLSSNQPEIETIIVSGDKDNFQLIDSRIKVYALRKGVKDTVLYDESLIGEKYEGLSPSQLLELRGLRGDPSDNIPGVKGIGEKTALKLVKDFGDLENIYENLPLITAKVREKLIAHKKEAFFSRELSQIKQNAPIDFQLENCRWGNYNKEKAIQKLKELEFYSLINRLN